jgi:hypothetical protein
VGVGTLYFKYSENNRINVIKREVFFLEKPSPENTQSVIEAVKQRLTGGDIAGIIIPVTTGKTAEQFREKLFDERIVTVSEEEAVTTCKLKARNEGGLLGLLVNNRFIRIAEALEKKNNREVFDMAFLPFCGEKWEAVTEILYAFGQGMKVAIEVSVAAVEIGKVQPFSRVIAVGGNEGGVDTAIVVKTSPKEEAFSGNYERRLNIEEIICMPIQKSYTKYSLSQKNISGTKLEDESNVSAGDEERD